ncbi:MULTISPECIES: M48 family metalloprotease [unclassified Ruegeria]|uniref:M48 family metalloprotease n=1 Tax=unclassified Ruegeria TaxID=2625375 RepID=UPI0014877DB3|nr:MULTISPECIES: M48 family metalloprotease [unclassified Ruegeria]
MRRLALLLAFVLAACDTSTLVLIPAAEWRPSSPELQVKAREFAEVSRAVGGAARRECLRASSDENCDFAVFVDPNPRAQANAFQTRDKTGRPIIIFTRAMLEATQNDQEMAFVMGHEAAHHILDHIDRQRQNVQESARIFGDIARDQGENAAGIERAQEIGANVGAQSYAQQFELEADRMGVNITYAAGYNPLIGMAFFQRIPDPGDQFLASHPPNAEREEAVLKAARSLGLVR